MKFWIGFLKKKIEFVLYSNLSIQFNLLDFFMVPFCRWLINPQISLTALSESGVLTTDAWVRCRRPAALPACLPRRTPDGVSRGLVPFLRLSRHGRERASGAKQVNLRRDGRAQCPGWPESDVAAREPWSTPGIDQRRTRGAGRSTEFTAAVSRFGHAGTETRLGHGHLR